MKIVKHIIIIFFIIQIFGCENKEDDLNRRANIVGTWDIDVLLEEVRADTVYRISNFETEYTFFDDGICITRNPTTGPDIEFTWFYIEDPQFVIINQLVEENRYIVRECQVLENTQESQTWVYEAQDINGFVDFWRNTWTMKKRL